MQIKKKIFILLIILFAVLFISNEIDYIICVVEGMPITYVQFKRAYEKNLNAAKQESFNVDEPKLKEDTLSQLIGDILIKQKAEEEGIAISDDNVYNALNGILDSNNLTMEQFINIIESRGMTFDEYFEIVRMQILMDTFFKIYIPKITQKPTRDEVVKEYEDTKENYRASTEYKVEVFSVSIPSGAKFKKLKMLKSSLNELKERLGKNEDFNTIKDDILSKNNIILKKEVKTMYKELESKEFFSNIAFLKSNSYSKVFKNNSNYMFVKLISKNDIEYIPLVAVENDLYEKMYKERKIEQFNSWVDEAKANAWIEWKEMKYYIDFSIDDSVN